MVIAEAQRTLVKSPPELWSELSDPAALARHLGELGEIRIVRTNPEQIVEWEARDTRGTVEIKPSGWGTRVRLSVTIDASGAQSPPQQMLTPDLHAEAYRERAEPDTAPPQLHEEQLHAPASTPQEQEPADGPAYGYEERAREPETAPPVIEPAPPVIPAHGLSEQPVGGLGRLMSRLRRMLRGRERGQNDRAAGAPVGALDARSPVDNRDAGPEQDHEEPVTPQQVREEPVAPPSEPLAPAAAELYEQPTEHPDATKAPPHAAPDEHGSTPAVQGQDPGASSEQQAAQTTALLSAMLDSLGEAHHRPFSRS
jgi:hypothetical protein